MTASVHTALRCCAAWCGRGRYTLLQHTNVHMCVREARQPEGSTERRQPQPPAPMLKLVQYGIWSRTFETCGIRLRLKNEANRPHTKSPPPSPSPAGHACRTTKNPHTPPPKHDKNPSIGQSVKVMRVLSDRQSAACRSPHTTALLPVTLPISEKTTLKQHSTQGEVPPA